MPYHLITAGAVVLHRAIAALAGHATGAHTILAAGVITTVPYLDRDAITKWYDENSPGDVGAKSTKFAIGGKLMSGKFQVINSAEPPKLVLLGFMNEGNGIVKSTIINPGRLEPSLAKALVGGGAIKFQ